MAGGSGTRPVAPGLRRRLLSCTAAEAHLHCYRLPCPATDPKQSCGRAKGPKRRSYLITSARCGEKYTVENTTLARYKNSHPCCHSVLSISSKNLLRWKGSSCSQSTLWVNDENPLPVRYRGEGPDILPGRVPVPVQRPRGGRPRASGRGSVSRPPHPL